MNKTNRRSDQPISSGSENEVAEILDTFQSATTIYRVHCKNNDKVGTSFNECEDSLSTFNWYEKPNIPSNGESRAEVTGEVFKNDNKRNANLNETEKPLFTETRYQAGDFANNSDSIMRDDGKLFKNDNGWELSVNESFTETVTKLQSKENDIKHKWEKIIKMRDLVLEEKHQLESKKKVSFQYHTS